MFPPSAPPKCPVLTDCRCAQPYVPHWSTRVLAARCRRGVDWYRWGMADDLSRNEIEALFPADLPETSQWQQRYPQRDLPEGAEVTRFCPSPTGNAHIGGIYAALIDKSVARHSGGVYVLRIEDTDQGREVEGATAQFDRVFAYFDVTADEDDSRGGYGPYTQSQRAPIYQSYVRELLRQGKAYPCFATPEELQTLRAEQEAAKVPTGYWGSWATWRDAPAEAVRERLAAGDPYVVRFRSPGAEAGRVTFTDRIRGTLTTDDNRNDIVILKSSTALLRLPTYHLAHAVDDHLMRATVVIRGDEWLASVPVHRQLFAALGFDQLDYAHIAPLMKLDGKNRRKLSKRKDPEAGVDWYIAAGYPADGVMYYLRGLANGRLAELPVEKALAEPIRLDECGVAGPLVDVVKLEDITADLIAAMSGEEILAHVRPWAAVQDAELAAAIDAEPDVALRALGIERGDVANPRKDLRKWSDFREVYGYFFASLFNPVTGASDERFGGLDADVLRALCSRFLEHYRHVEDGDAWFDQIREAAAQTGFAPSPKAYKQDPGAFPGSVREAAQAIRVLLTGSTRSPAFHLVAEALGEDAVRRRVAVLDTTPA